MSTKQKSKSLNVKVNNYNKEKPFITRTQSLSNIKYENKKTNNTSNCFDKFINYLKLKFLFE